jgi:hypothetical protein
MNINIEQAVKDLQEKGYHQAVLFTDPNDLIALEAELKEMKAEHYNPSNLEAHSVYLSDKTDTRESHAMMIARGRSDLPQVNVYGTRIMALLNFHDQVVGDIIGKTVPVGSRSMLNFQEYLSGSKPVAEHFDGEYLKYEKVDGTNFKLREGLLPRYVMVFTVRNENVGLENEGTVLREVSTNEVTNCQSRPGQVLIFDNIRFRHSVPQLVKPRLMCGLRNFDFEPVYFVDELVTESQGKIDTEEAQLLGWSVMNDKNNPGLIVDATTEAAIQRQLRYVANEWPKQFETMKKEGAVF